MWCQPSQQLRQRQRQPQLQLLLSLGVLLGPAVAQHPHPYPQQPRLRQPQPCASALRRLCPASWWASASACSVCAQQNAQTLNQSGCDSAIVARCCAERPPDPPQLPRQSRGQAAAQQRAWAVARTASPAAVPAVVALLDAPPTRSYLRQFDSGDQLYLLSRSTYALRGSDSGDSGAASHGGSNGPMVADRPLTLNYAENMFGYFEVNPVATIPMSRQGIKMMIGSFGLLWGTAQGSRLREWSATRGWPLAWAYNPRVAGLCMTGPQPPPAGCLHARTAIENMTEDAVAVRLLDPKVLAQVAEGHNCSNAPTAATFERIWETASNVTSNISLGFGARQTRLRALWRELLQGEAVVNAFGVEPLCKPRHLTPFLMAAPSGVLMLTRVRVSQTTGRAGAWTASACALRTLAVCVPSMRESERDCQRGGSRGAWPIYHCHPPPGRGIEARPSCLPAGARARLAC